MYFIKFVLLICFLFEFSNANDIKVSELTDNAFYTLSYYKAKCLEGNQSACVYVGLAQKDGNDTQQDFKKAYDLFQKACEQNNALGCAFEGLMYEEGLGRNINLTQSIVLYQKACDGGIELSCQRIKQLSK